MSANCVARKIAMRAPRSLIQNSRRGISTRSVTVAAPQLLVQAATIEFGVLNNTVSRNSPACGWRKTIVSSSSSMPANDESASSFEAISIAKAELEKSAKVDGLRLEVDMEELQTLALMRCTPLSLREMYKYAVDFNNQEQRLLNAQFLHKELAIRMAQRAVDLLTLPHGLSEALPIQQIAHVYLRYLEKFQEFLLPTTNEEENAFTDMLQTVVLDRASIPNAIAQGVDAWLEEKDHKGMEEERLQEMEDALYRFFTARVGLRFLTEHHILTAPSRAQSALRKSQSSHNDSHFLGCIETDCCPSKEVRKITETVARQTQEYYGICPEIQIVDSSTQKKDTQFTYVPHHLHYMVGELLKNSCRATVKRYLESKANGEDVQISPIRVVIVKGEEDVTIKIADRGGGIPRSKMATIWKFAHSTAADEESTCEFGVDEVTGAKIRGFGLPLARIYARYLGGELTLKSMEGYGLDAYLHMPRLGDCCENLPLPVKFSPGELNSNPPRNASRRI